MTDRSARGAGAAGKTGGGEPSLTAVALRALSFLLLQSAFGRIISIAGQLAIAWYLTPADFGLVGLAVTINAISQVIVVFGLDDVLVQRGRSLVRWAGPVRLIILIIACCVALLLVVLSTTLANAFSQPGLRNLLILLASGIPAFGLAVVPGAELRRDLRFGFLALYATIEIVTVQLATVGLAAYGFGPHAVVIPIVVAAWARAGTFTWVAPVNGLLSFRRAKIGLLVRAGSFVFSSRLLAMLIRQGDSLILGLFVDPVSLGAYYFAYKIASQPLFLLAGSVTNVLMPVLVRLSGDPGLQRQNATKALSALGYIVLPCGFLQALLAGPLLTLAFGAKWQAAVPLIQLLSIGLSFEAFLWVAGAYMSARRRFDLILIYSVINLSLFASVVIFGAVAAGSTGAALCVGFLYVLLAPIECALVFRLSVREVATVCLRPAFVAGVPALAAWLVGRALTGNLVAATAILAVLYVSGLIVVVRLLEPVLWRRLVMVVRTRSFSSPAV